MATSPNYSWPEPDNTDLVKNGALAMRTLGNAIDTTMATMTPKSTVTAKGSLIAATAASTPANLAVGNNGETLVADSSTATGLRYQNFKTVNYCLNSDTSIWQRGTSIAAAGSVVYGADRWSFFRIGLATGATMSRQSAALTGFQYSMRIQRDSGNTNTEQIISFQALESAQSIPLAGKTVTFSFWAKAGANFSASGSAMSATLITGTGNDQSPNAFRAGSWTSQTTALTVSPTITTSWARYQGTATLGSSITQVGINLGFTPTGTAGANDWIEVTGMQLEIGSIATAFQTATGTIQGELAACQRYLPAIAASNGEIYTGQCYSTTAALIPVVFPVTARVAPTGITVNSAGNFRLRSAVATKLTITAINFSTGTVQGATIEGIVAAGLVAGNATNLFNESSGTILFTGCEL